MLEKQTWTKSENCLTKEFHFSSFEQAMGWMLLASKKISEMDYHPEWTNIYNVVKIKLSTHSANNTITEKDHELANFFDSIEL